MSIANLFLSLRRVYNFQHCYFYKSELAILRGRNPNKSLPGKALIVNG